MDYHVLNGDALKSQLLQEISGEVIVMRECLIEGPVKAFSLEEFSELRSKFISTEYRQDNYVDYTLPELEKIQNLSGGNVYLWFEEDLFCQCNLWFVCSLLYQKSVAVSLILPSKDLLQGFGGMNTDELNKAFHKRINLTGINVNQFALLWFAYRDQDIERLLKLGVQLHSEFPFVMTAIEAHFERLPNDNSPGEPHRIMKEIVLNSIDIDFKQAFREFSSRASIYGYGDLQVRKIYDQVRLTLT